MLLWKRDTGQAHISHLPQSGMEGLEFCEATRDAAVTWFGSHSEEHRPRDSSLPVDADGVQPVGRVPNVACTCRHTAEINMVMLLAQGGKA